MKFQIRKEKEDMVSVWLKQEGDSIMLMVGDWYVFTLNADGTGCLDEGIDEENVEGLQVDDGGRIILED